MNLTIAERFMAQNTLPPQGTLVTLRIVMEAQQVLGLSSDEIARYKVVTNDGMTTWDPDHAATLFDIPLTAAAIEVLKEELDKLNAAAKLTFNHVPLFEKVHAAASG